MSSKTVTERWQEGLPHNPKSEALYQKIAKADWEQGGDFFCFKQGGDGDNGEHLMYLLDIVFETEESEGKK